MTTASGLRAVSTEDLERLLSAIRHDRVSCPIAPTGLAGLHLNHLQDKLAILAGLPAEACAAVLTAVLSERAESRTKLELVWTGPEGHASESRDTRVVVRELFGQAQSHVLIGGYAFDHGQDIFRPLFEAMRDRGVKTEIFLDLRSQAESVDAVGAHATMVIDRFLATNWPFGEPKPAVYYDPRTATPGVYASLHAKCVVVDRCKSLITSANFTDRGQTRNIEAGVLIDDPAFGVQLVRQWRGLVGAGLVVGNGCGV